MIEQGRGQITKSEDSSMRLWRNEALGAKEAAD